MCTPAVLSKHFSWPQMDFRAPLELYQSLTADEWHRYKKKCWEHRVGRVLREIHFWPGPIKLNTTFWSETRLHPSDSAIHHTMLFDLKRVFFIYNFEVISTVPIGKKSVASSYFPGRGSGVGAGLVPCSRALPQNSCLISHGLEFGHERFLQATILYSYLIIKGYFS